MQKSDWINKWNQSSVLENHNFCKNKLKYQNLSYERAYEKAEL